MKKLLVLGIVAIAVISGVIIWGGISLIRFASGHLSTVTVESCLNKAQSMMNATSWVTVPVVDNLKDLKTACLEAEAPICEGDVCQNMKQRMSTAESGKRI